MLSPIFAETGYDFLHHYVSIYKVHPILVNFTAALIPISLGSDILGKILRKQSLTDTGWWTLLFAALITPLTAAAGWFFWMADDNGVIGMTIHKWLGTSLAALFIILMLWRWRFFRSNSRPSFLYLLGVIIIFGLLVYQGHLGGNQSFG